MLITAALVWAIRFGTRVRAREQTPGREATRSGPRRRGGHGLRARPADRCPTHLSGTWLWGCSRPRTTPTCQAGENTTKLPLTEQRMFPSAWQLVLGPAIPPK
ncbi:hypothetical protein ABZ490_26655 [Streptomyces sp. NPDC005811]|uniref:hypothetical protein n=1 Tax=Streptomyces sp. NPDC005811 TaxID=3154565 RepID=UPI0033DE1484